MFTFLKKQKLTILFIVLILVFSPFVVFYDIVNSGYSKEEILVEPKPNDNSSLLPTLAPMNSTLFVLEKKSGSFGGPLGVFGITFPSNQTYDSNIVSLEVEGHVIVARNVNLSLVYSVDGNEVVPLSIVFEHKDHLSFVRAFSGFAVLSPLSQGFHNITVLGDLKINGESNLSEAFVCFIVSENYE